MPLTDVHHGNPLEVVEHVASRHLWPFERACDDELVIVMRGKWADYQVSFTWLRDIEALHLACAFDLKAPELEMSDPHLHVDHRDQMLDLGIAAFWSFKVEGTSKMQRLDVTQPSE
jgi:hypothetical protein